MSETGAVAGQGTAGDAAAGRCLNCGCALTGAYCHCCGQKGEVHRTLGAFWHDLIHGVFHFEGKTWRTLPLLAWRPGDLTRRYIAGERASFVSPMALFLFSVFLMFIVFTTVGGPFDIRSGTAVSAESTAEDGGERGEGKLTVGRTGIEVIDNAIAKAEANPDLLLYKFQNNAYKFSWLLIPLSVPLVWLLFLHRRRYRQFRAYDHLVFVTYSIAFMTLGLVVLTALRLVGVAEAMIGLAIFLVPPVHIYRQLRGAYSLSRWSALWRTAALLVFSVVAAALFLGILVLIGVIG